MKIKICGIKYKDNLKEILELNPDYLGFIFYKKSKRYMRNTILKMDIENISHKKVGVFVNSSIREIQNIVNEFRLDAIQLHGSETPETCHYFKSKKVEVIKAFSVGDGFNFNSTKKYQDHCDYFLFDTKGKNKGGNGVAFDWSLLNKYNQHIPFFISGGIGLDNINEIKGLGKFNLYGVDLNSKMEDSPGIKNIAKLKKAIAILKTFTQ